MYNIFMTFSTKQDSFDSIIIRSCTDNKSSNTRSTHTWCKRIKEVSRIRYLRIIFVNNLRWNSQLNNLVGKLREITYKFAKPENHLPTQIIRITYFALYQLIHQYGFLVWGGLCDSILKQRSKLMKTILFESL